MADTSYVVDLILQAKNQATAELNKIGENIDQLKENSTKLSESTKTALKAVGVTATAVAGSMVALGKKYIDAGNNQIEVETKLATVLKQRTNATDEQIENIKRLTAQQQKLGIIGDEVQMAGLQQLSTFVSTTDAVEKLAPAMNNLLAQQKGYNASAGDAVNIGNLMGKVLQGQTAALTRVGVTFTEAQEQVLKFGTEEEKAAMLAQVITDNVGNMNEALADTFQGRVTQLNNTLGDLGETIGMALIPIITKLLEKIQPVIDKFVERVENHGDLLAKIIAITGAIAGVTAVVAGLGLALPAITTAIGILTGPIGLVLGAITALGVAWATNFGGIRDKTQEVIDFIKPYIENFVANLKAFWDEYGTAILTGVFAFWELIKVTVQNAVEIIGTLFETLFLALGALLDVFQGDWQGAWEKIKTIGQTIAKSIDKIMTNAFGDMWTNIKNGFMEGYNWIVEKVNALVDTIKRAVQSLKNAWNSAKEWLSGGGGGDGTRASGGPVYAGQQYLVGENGPEMFIPSQNGSIVKNEDLNSMGAGSPITVNINMGGVAVSNGQDEQSLADTIAETITRQLELYKKGIY